MNLKDETQIEKNIEILLSNKDLENEFMIAVRTLAETKSCHDPSYYDLIYPRIGKAGLNIPNDKFDFKESLTDILNDDNVLIPVKFYGTISSISNPYAKRLINDSGTISNFSAIDLELKDFDSITVKTIPVVTDKIKKKISDLSRRYSLFCFYGMVSYGLKKRKRPKKISTDDFDYQFIIKDLEPAENLLEINNYSDTEIKTAKKLIKKLAKNNGIRKHIISKVSKGLGIKGLKQAPLLQASLEFLVLQSFSDNTIDGRSAKLHSLIIGPPAVGKGKLMEAIQVLNHIYNGASGSRWSSAGLIANTKGGAGKNKSEPGLIPLSHRGIFAMQDFHEAKNKHDLFGIISQVMEDGIASDSMVSRTTHKALTSIHLDMNKLPDVYMDDSKKFTKGRFQELKKIGIPLNILSRFDFIVDIKRDINIQMALGRNMLGSGSGSKILIRDLVLEPWVRNIQAIVAVLRTDLPEITILPQIVNYMEKKYDELMKKVDSSVEYISDFILRLPKSFKKLIIATCRANARKKATKDDVDYAFRFLELKLKFLMSVKPVGAGNDAHSNTVIPPEYLISIKFEGETITLSEAREFVNSHIKSPVGDRQIRRYLEDNFKKAGHGKWKITKLTY